MASADLRLSYGAMFIGSVIAVFLDGASCLQMYQYFRQCQNKDSRIIRSMVCAVWILDLTHTIFICQAMWYYLVLNWGDLEELDVLIWSIAGSVALTGIVIFIIQIFFTIRVWRFSKQNICLGTVITFMAVVRLGSALATTVKMTQLGRFSTFLDKFRWLFTFGLGMSCAVELLLTASLCYYLRVNRSGYSTMDEIIHRLLMYTISNGIWTTLGTLLAMLFAIVSPNSFLFIALHFIIVKSYVNSLFATLNSRESLKKRSNSTPVAYQISVDGHSQPRFRRYTPHHITEPGSNDRPIPLSDAGNFSGAERPSAGNVKVHVRVEQEVQHSDADMERESSPERRFKSLGLSPSDDEVHTTVKLPHRS